MRLEYRRGLLIVSICFSVWSFTPGIAFSAETQSAMTADACIQLRNSNAEMKKIIGQIITDHKDNKRFINAFNKAQKAWSAFRDADMNAVYPESPQSYGSAYGMCRCTLLNEMTRERIDKLKKWLSGDTEGDVCAGSMDWKLR